MSKKFKRYISLFGISLTIAIGIIYVNKDEKSDKSTENITSSNKNKQLYIDAIILDYCILSDDIISIGTTIPDEIVDLTFETSGKIIAIYFKEGTYVNKGDLLAKINDAPLQAELKKLEAELPLANSRVYRQATLLEKDAISQEAYDIVSTDLLKLQASIDLVKTQISLTEMRAPFSGTIGLRNVSVGAYASPGVSLANLTKTRPIKIDFSYPERYSNAIKKGTSILFSVDGISEKFEAEIYAVDPNIDSEIKTQTARAIFNNKTGALNPGRFVNVHINLDKKEDAIAVPSHAMISEVGNDLVYRYKNGIAEAVKVEIGMRTESKVEILSGLSVGDTIITTGMMQMRHGLNVKINQLN